MPDFNAFDIPDPTVPAADSPSDEAPPRARPARRAPRQSRARRLTEQVLNATAEVLVRRGHAGLSTNSVAAQAGVSVGALYQYFPDKAALLAAVRERHARAMGQALLAAWADAAPTRLDTAVQALVRGLFAAHALEPTLHDRLEQDGPLVVTLPSHPDGVVCRVPCEASALMAPGAVWAFWRQRLQRHEAQFGVAEPALAVWVALQMADGLAHAAWAGASRAPLPFAVDALEQAAVQAVCAYLAGPSGHGR